MEKIIPVAGATGSHSFAATMAIPPVMAYNVDEETPHIPPTIDDTRMDIDQPVASASTNIPLQPTMKRPRSDNDDDVSIYVAHHPSSNPPATPPPPSAVPSDRSRKSRKTLSEKGKGKARTTSERSSNITSSTSHRVDKITPAVAIVELHGSIKDMTQAIVDASKPPETIEDKAAVRTWEVVQLVQLRDDGLRVMEKAALLVFFGTHSKEADMYIALEDGELRRAVINRWIRDDV
jgi:hypothetical protein